MAVVTVENIEKRANTSYYLSFLEEPGTGYLVSCLTFPDVLKLQEGDICSVSAEYEQVTKLYRLDGSIEKGEQRQ